MKLVLRILVVVVLIVGLIFGINYCNSLTSNEQQIINFVENTVNISLDVESRFEEINSLFTAEKPTESLNNLKIAYEGIKPFIAEVYMAKDVKKEEVEEFKILASSVKENYETLTKTINNFKGLKENAPEQYKKNYMTQISNQIEECENDYVAFSLKVLNFVKVNVHNGLEVNSELNSAISTISALQNKGE